MAKGLKQGDKVSWHTSQGETHGVVEKKQFCLANGEEAKVATTTL